MVKAFSGDLNFLCNFYPVTIHYEGINYPSSEAAFQAAKTLDVSKRLEFSLMTPGQAKRAGRKLKLRDDWELVKLQVMEDILRIKFAKGTELYGRLKATLNIELVEINSWHDNFWGDCQCDSCVEIPGENYLGKILMKIRSEQ